MQRKSSGPMPHLTQVATQFSRRVSRRGARRRVLTAALVAVMLTFSLWAGIHLPGDQFAETGNAFHGVVLAAPAAQQDSDDEDEDATDTTQDDDSTTPDAEVTPDVIAEDDETVEIPQVPELELGKSFDGFSDMDDTGELSAGDVISYGFAITNTGNVTLGELSLRDDLLALEEATCEETSLAPLATASCVFTYTVTADDILAGSITNLAIATAIAPDDTEIEAEATTTIEIPQNAALALEKSFGGFSDEDDNGELSLGDVITYSFAISNTGNVALDPVTLTDEMLELEAIVCGESSLAPGDSTSCEHTYTITQADVDAGEIYNQATVTGIIAEPEATD